MISPVPEGPASRYVDPVFQHSGRRFLGFVPDLVKAGSVGFVFTAVDDVGIFFVAKKAGARRFVVGARASNTFFFETSIWAVADR